ncbi:hypothetical protein L6452_30087 [Arctium lappa]|uniref:Uncharacterized protein n=1 Tax=Arctium lappa TaxID=4217 RepID=A0ACB8ZIQ8_ARCLA|nr:hypothetical protein L6452_30087 [Arctium lappa]
MSTTDRRANRRLSDRRRSLPSCKSSSLTEVLQIFVSQIVLASNRADLTLVCPSHSDSVHFCLWATAFGMNSVVYVPRIKPETIAALSAFCEKANMVSTGIDTTPTSGNSAAFQYNHVEIVESKVNAGAFPSQESAQIANNLSNLGQLYNREDLETDVPAIDFLDKLLRYNHHDRITRK